MGSDFTERYDTVKKRLIICGISEIEEHGLTDFSLRRVAAQCNVSCAAPYKHFKNKDDLILEIIKYISGQWKLLENQIIKIYSGTKKQIEEISVAYVRFWLANPNFRSILLMNPRNMDEKQKSAKADIDKTITALISRHCENAGLSKEISMRKTYEIRSLIYGALLMLDSGEIQNCAQSIDMIRTSIRKVCEL